MIAVGFDFDHTLGFDHKLERTAFLDVATRLGSATTAHTEGLIDAALVAYRSGAAPIDTAICTAFAGAVPGTNSAEAFNAFRERALELVPAHVTAAPGALELIALLDAHNVRHAILTNGWSPLQEHKAAAVGYRGPVLVSDVLGLRKPAATAFAALVAKLGAATNIWYVGDDPAIDVAGAIGAGLRAVWLNPEKRPYRDDLPPPTATVHRLADVPAAISLMTVVR